MNAKIQEMLRAQGGLPETPFAANETLMPGISVKVAGNASVPYLAGWESREHYMVAYQPKRPRLNGKGWPHQQHLDRRLSACAPTQLAEENR